MSSAKNQDGKKSQEVKYKGQKFALVFYQAEKKTGIIMADSRITKRKMGTRVRVGYPIDWTGPQEDGVQFDAVVVKFGHDAEFLSRIPVGLDGKEIKESENKENIAKAAGRSKAQDKLEHSAKFTATSSITAQVNKLMPLFNVDGTLKDRAENQDVDHAEQARLESEAEQARLESEAEQARLESEAEQARLESEAEQSRLESEAEKACQAAQEEQARQAAEVERARQAAEAERARQAAEAERARQAAEAEQARQAAEAEQARQAAEAERARHQEAEEENATEFNVVEFKAKCEQAKERKERLDISSFPHLECLYPSNSNTPLGDPTVATIFIPVQAAINMPWVVPKPADTKRRRVPTDKPNAVYPRALVSYLLKAIVPNEVMYYVSGSILPSALLNPIRDYVNSRLEFRYKLQDKHFVEMISDYHRALGKRMKSGKEEAQPALKKRRLCI